MGSCRLMGLEFQFCKTNRALEIGCMNGPNPTELYT